MKEFVQSYKDLSTPLSVYQFQNKFRNEARAKSGILRCREFLMKDMYSFHANEADLDRYYARVTAAYHAIFDRLGIGSETHYTYASGGSFTDKFSHEFQTRLSVGEDLVFRVPTTGKCYNQEVAPCKAVQFTGPFAQSDVYTTHTMEGVIGVEALCARLGIVPQETVKTLLYMADETIAYAFCVR
jgi:prolyl-tRNA synthetase